MKLVSPKNYGVHLGILDEEYKKLGVKILKNENEIINNADVVVQLGILSEEKYSFSKRKSNFNRRFKPL